MSCEWETIKLRDCGQWLSGRTPSKKQPEYWDGNIPWVSPKDMGVFFIDDSQDHITRRAVDESSLSVVPPNTILFVVRSMTLGHTFQIALARREITFNQDLKAIRVHDEIDPEFLFYAMRARRAEILALVDEASHGTKRLRTDTLGDYEIPLPPLPLQKHLANIAKTLDDKIDLNRKMNQTLEAMARAIFKSWFVDFDPVHVKQRGKQPTGLAPETADLFPSQLTDSKLGKIPQGWEVKPIKEVINITPRYKLSKGDTAPYLKMANAPEEGHYPHDWYDREFNGSGSKFTNGDTLMAKITPCLENGKTAFVDFLPDDDTIGWGSTEYLVLRSREPYPLEYSYYLARSRRLRRISIKSMSGASSRQRVSVRGFKKFKIVVPPPEIAQRFGEIARDLMTKIRANHKESRTLANLRDVLLPKLLSGELIPDDISSNRNSHE